MRREKKLIGLLVAIAILSLGGLFIYRESTIDVYIIRHGQTDANLKKLAVGYLDIPLNETGVKQAEQLSKGLADRHIPIIYASPLSRAQATASIIAQKTHSTIITDDLLKERNLGKAEGIPKKELDNFLKEHPDAEAESLESQSKRIAKFVSLHAEFGIHQLYIVAHGGIIRRMIEIAGGNNAEVKKIKNCSVFEFKYNLLTKKHSFVGCKTFD